MAYRGQMDPDLVGPAGFEPAEQEARHRLLRPAGFAGLVGFGGVALEHLKMGDRLAAALADRHALARLRMAVDRPVDGAMRTIRRAPNEGQIGALERLAAFAVVGELLRQAAMGAVV